MGRKGRGNVRGEGGRIEEEGEEDGGRKGRRGEWEEKIKKKEGEKEEEDGAVKERRKKI